MKIILLCTFLILATSCYKTPNDIEVPKGASLSIEDGSQLFGIASVVKYISKDSILMSGKYSILGLFVKGTFTHTIGKKGNGPGEYEQLGSFSFRKDTVYIYDPFKGIIQFFNLKDGSYLGKEVFDDKNLKQNIYGNFTVTDQFYYFVNNGYLPSHLDDMPLIIRVKRRDPNIVEVIAKVRDSREEKNPMSYLNSLYPFYKNGSIYFTYPHSDKIISISQSTLTISKIEIAIFKKDIDELNRLMKSGKLSGDNGYYLYFDQFERPFKFFNINDSTLLYTSERGSKKGLISKLYFINTRTNSIKDIQQYKEMPIYWADETDLYFYDWANRSENEILKIVTINHGVQ